MVSGRKGLPEEQEQALRKAIRIEWLSIAFTTGTVILVFFVLGNSQAMRTAWIEDILSVIPQIAFLIAIVIVRRPRNRSHPYGYHRAMGVGHLVGAVALIVVGGILLIESVMGLIRGEHPTIGTVQVFGQTIWQGWLMIGVMALIAAPPVLFGRAKMKLAEKLHNKLLFADADMSKADWSTSVGSIVGVAGIGLGIWWADSAAATFIAASIVWDGLKNTRAAVLDLMDKSATTFDQKKPHPLIGQIDEALRELDWVEHAGSRVRDEGQVFHIESFVVPRGGTISIEQTQEAVDAAAALDWKVQDMVVVPVEELPTDVVTDGSERIEVR
jgi:cation diffusion facilitator family transporter